MNLTPEGYMVVFVLGCVFNAGGFYYVTRAAAGRLRKFEEKLGEAREDIAWIKGRLNGGTKKR